MHRCPCSLGEPSGMNGGQSGVLQLGHPCQPLLGTWRGLNSWVWVVSRAPSNIHTQGFLGKEWSDHLGSQDMET